MMCHVSTSKIVTEVYSAQIHRKETPVLYNAIAIDRQHMGNFSTTRWRCRNRAVTVPLFLSQISAGRTLLLGDRMVIKRSEKVRGTWIVWNFQVDSSHLDWGAPALCWWMWPKWARAAAPAARERSSLRRTGNKMQISLVAASPLSLSSLSLLSLPSSPLWSASRVQLVAWH